MSTLQKTAPRANGCPSLRLDARGPTRDPDGVRGSARLLIRDLADAYQLALAGHHRAARIFHSGKDQAAWQRIHDWESVAETTLDCVRVQLVRACLMAANPGLTLEAIGAPGFSFSTTGVRADGRIITVSPFMGEDFREVFDLASALVVVVDTDESDFEDLDSEED